MSDLAIRVENLGKRYRIGQIAGYKTLRDSLTGAFSAPLRRLRSHSGRANSAVPSSTIWALKDVSFDVKYGETIGIIGRNGCGKSTLLKILSRITAPSEGFAEIHGRVGSLLEVGTGFHPELTGRENIYLNGAVLGMKRAEIARKFDEIVAFAEVEKFLDTPVKHYSSGMYVRLAFAVAAHLEPEILVVDEVLAVGDAEFQKKCLGRMGELANGGRTVLFVSHNLNAIEMICNRAILLRDGQMITQGTTDQVVAEYMSSRTDASGEISWLFENAPGSEKFKLHVVRVVNDLREICFDTNIGMPINVEIDFWCLQKTTIVPIIHVYNQQGNLLFMSTNLQNESLDEIEYEPGTYRYSCQIPSNFLNEGTHFVNVYLSTNIRLTPEVSKEPAISFQAHDYGTGQRDFINRPWMGMVRPRLIWNHYRIGDLP